jgi:hypothetical protein
MEQLKESTILEKLSRAREQEKEAHKVTPRSTTYEVGDRVRINNTVKAPFGRRVNAQDQTAPVLSTKSIYTKLNGDQTRVFIQTDNGFKTWRLEKNLNKIQ